MLEDRESMRRRGGDEAKRRAVDRVWKGTQD